MSEPNADECVITKSYKSCIGKERHGEERTAVLMDGKVPRAHRPETAVSKEAPSELVILSAVNQKYKVLSGRNVWR